MVERRQLTDEHVALWREGCALLEAVGLREYDRGVSARVTDERVKERLKGTTIAPNQERVASAPLICLILGDLNGHNRLEGILDETVHAGLLPREVADVWFTMANGMYGSDPRLARDEAIRSGSLAAMTLMLAAGNRGYVSCPIGFNPVQVMEILSISDHYVPVMMLTVGRPAFGNNPRRARLPVDQVLAFNTSHDFLTLRIY